MTFSLRLPVLISFLLLVRATKAQSDPCLAASYPSTGSFGTTNTYHQNYGGIAAMDKITKIELWKGPWPTLFDTDKVSKMRVTFKVDGEAGTKSVTFGNGGNGAGSVDFPDGIYLTKMVVYDRGGFVGRVQFCRSDGRCFGPFGGPGGTPTTHERADSTISALKYRAGAVVDKLAPVYETNGLLQYDMDDDVIVTRLGGTNLEDTNVNTAGTNGVLNVFDNLDGNTPIIYDRLLSVTTQTSRSTTVTSVTQTDVSFSLNIQGIFKGIIAEASLSSNFMQRDTSETTNSFSEEKIVQEQINFSVQPGTKVTLDIAYRTFNFEYSFSGGTRCIYKHAPGTSETGGRTTGTIFGREAFDGMLVTIQTDEAPTETPITQAPVVTPTTLAPNPAPTAAPTSQPSSCFSGSNYVDVRGKGEILMRDLQLGDYVRSSLEPSGEYSRVYSFAHFAPNQQATFLKILFEDQEETLEMSSEHMVDVNNKMVPASMVQRGDHLSHQIVRAVEYIQVRGVYAPVTESGRLVVSNVVASSYVQLLEQVPFFHQISHVLVAPLRAYCCSSLGRSYCETELYDEHGYSSRLLPWLNIAFAVQVQPVAVQWLLMLAVAPVLVALWVARVALTHPSWTMLCLLYLYMYRYRWSIKGYNGSSPKSQSPVYPS